MLFRGCNVPQVMLFFRTQKNFFWDTKKLFSGIRNAFSRHSQCFFFFSENKSFLVDQKSQNHKISKK